MKNQILDEPFDKSIVDQFQLNLILQKGIEKHIKEEEKILWTGKPEPLKAFRNHDFLLIGYLLFLFYFYRFLPESFWDLVFVVAIIQGVNFFTHLMRRASINETHYAIAESKIFWAFTRGKNIGVFFIEFENIKFIEIEDDAIFIFPKDKSKVNFETLSYEEQKERYRPTLEKVYNHHEVAKLIETQIEKHNSK